MITFIVAMWAIAASGLAWHYGARLHRVRKQLVGMVGQSVPAKRLNSNHLPHVSP